MAWASHVSRRINLDLAVEEAVACALKDKQWQPQLAIVFLSSAYVAEFDKLVAQLRKTVPSLKYIVGSTGYGVIGTTAEGPEEIEHAPALSLTLADLPGVDISITHLTAEDLPDGDAPPDTWAKLLGMQLQQQQQQPDASGSSSSHTNFIVLADPEFTRLMELTAGLDFAWPAAMKIGGLVSAGKMSPARAAFAWSAAGEEKQKQQQQQQQAEAAAEQQPADDQRERQQRQRQRQEASVLRSGAVVLGLQGPLAMELLVAQGCRPLGPSTFTIDRARGQVVQALRDGKGALLSPVEALQQELRAAASSKQELLLLLRNVALGLVPEVLLQPGQQLEPQDFLIRGMALDRSGCMVVGDKVKVGQRVRFMVRDRDGAQQDLTSHCLAYKRRELAATLSGRPAPAAFGMLLFSCNGRGMNLYDEPSYDSRTLASYVPVPCSGFMCNGEIGTIGGATHLHGFTCAAAVLRAAAPVTPAAAEASGNEGANSSTSSSSGSSSSSGGSAQGQGSSPEL